MPIFDYSPNIEIAKKVITELQFVLNNTAIGTYPRSKMEHIRSKYSFLSDVDFEALLYKGDLCSGVALNFMNHMKLIGVPAYYLFVYHKPFIRTNIDNFNAKYSKYIIDGVYVNAQILLNKTTEVKPIESMDRHTYALVEVAIDNFRFVVDPYCGLFYPFGKEELIRNPDKVYDAYNWLSQSNYIANNIHRNRDQLIYATPLFWSNIYHISYDVSGGLPPFFDL